MSSERVFVALGTNLGDRLLNLQEARRRLGGLRGVALRPEAFIVQTPAMLAEGDTQPQPPYLNTVLELRTDLVPRALLSALLELERAMGRTRSTRWAPRVIDLDLVLYGQRQLEAPGLTLPHPGLASRRFVLEPLAALAPDLTVPPTNRRVRELLAVLGPVT